LAALLNTIYQASKWWEYCKVATFAGPTQTHPNSIKHFTLSYFHHSKRQAYLNHENYSIGFPETKTLLHHCPEKSGKCGTKEPNRRDQGKILVIIEIGGAEHFKCHFHEKSKCHGQGQHSYDMPECSVGNTLGKCHVA